jgi:maltooligosyltrehalose trehalohydrolase
MDATNSLGAVPLDGGQCLFTVWAPDVQTVTVDLSGGLSAPMSRDEWGYHTALMDNVGPGVTYQYRLDQSLARPDPASRYQPEGVHGPSQVVAPAFPWTDEDWKGLSLDRYVIYELHVGTYTQAGTFDAVLGHLPYLKDLGITALEIMPVAQFPGDRNWGYDGVYPFAAQNTYGGPEGLKRLVDACHTHGLAVVLDVVYNHLGPEGNYLNDFGPYFTDLYKTPWGAALNFDGQDSDHVRRYFIENALYWLVDCHVDALRLDAVHAILDHSAFPFIEELGVAVREASTEAARPLHLIAESADNDARLTSPREKGGYGMDAQWNDDFHHALHTMLTGEKTGYYQDFGQLEQLAKAYREGFVNSGEYSPYLRRRHGTDSSALPGTNFVVCAQNHDQVGNRMLGERLGTLITFEARKLAAAALLLSPFPPLLFMGEEYGETAPFLYFVSHTDGTLVEAVRQGRAEEFTAFGWKERPPDPQSEETFIRSKLNHSLRNEGEHAALLGFYRELLRMRREHPALAALTKEQQRVYASPRERVLTLHRWSGRAQAYAVFHFGEEPRRVELPAPPGDWRRALDSADSPWAGLGASAPTSLSTGQGPTVSVNLASHNAALFLQN